jgi:Uma2 family endonuclease
MPIVRTAQPRVSFTDLQQMPDDGRRYELYDGEVVELTGPIPLHQVVANNIKRVLEAYSKAHGGLSLVSPIDIVFSEYDVVQPDVVYFTQARRHLVDFYAAIRHAPDLVVEVLSPSTRGNDRGRKMQMFARFGVPEYWIADPSTACLEVHGLQGTAYHLIQTGCSDDVVHSPHLTDLAFKAGEAFRLP